MKPTQTDDCSEAEPAAATFHRPGEVQPYSSFDSELQLWRGSQLRKYYADLAEPTIRRRPADTKVQSSIDFWQRWQELKSRL